MGSHGLCPTEPAPSQQELHVGGRWWGLCPFRDGGELLHGRVRSGGAAEGMQQQSPKPRCYPSRLNQSLSRISTPNPNPGWPCGPCLLTHSRWGHHMSKPGSWETRTPGNRQMANGGRGRAGTQGPLQRGGGRSLGSASPGWPSACLVLTAHRGFLRPSWSPAGSEVRPGLLGRGDMGVGKSLGHIF